MISRMRALPPPPGRPPTGLWAARLMILAAGFVCWRLVGAGADGAAGLVTGPLTAAAVVSVELLVTAWWTRRRLLDVLTLRLVRADRLLGDGQAGARPAPGRELSDVDVVDGDVVADELPPAR